MKLYEVAKQMGKKSKDLLAEIDDPRVKTHMSLVPESIVAELLGSEKKIEEAIEEPTETVDSAEAVVVVAKAEPAPVAPTCPVDLITMATSIRGLGGKSPYYKWKHMLNA
jgi:hypothetical protein